MITCLYSCKKCGIVKRAIQIPARGSASVDIVQYLEKVVAPVIGEDHSKVSPNCKNDKINDLMIPCPKEAEFIGQQIE